MKHRAGRAREMRRKWRVFYEGKWTEPFDEGTIVDGLESGDLLKSDYVCQVGKPTPMRACDIDWIESETATPVPPPPLEELDLDDLAPRAASPTKERRRKQPRFARIAASGWRSIVSVVIGVAIGGLLPRLPVLAICAGVGTTLLLLWSGSDQRRHASAGRRQLTPQWVGLLTGGAAGLLQGCLRSWEELSPHLVDLRPVHVATPWYGVGRDILFWSAPTVVGWAVAGVTVGIGIAALARRTFLRGTAATVEKKGR